MTARRPSLALAASVAALGGAACMRTSSPAVLRPAEAAQRAPDAPEEGAAELGGVRVRIALDAWRGDPKDLELRLTPVDVLVENASGRPVRLDPERFSLRVGGARLPPLDEREVSRALADLGGFGRAARRPAGPPGTVPGYGPPGDPFARGPMRRSPVPPPGQWHASLPPSGVLASGQRAAVLLFFDVPARGLASATFELDLLADGGTHLGTISIPWRRE